MKSEEKFDEEGFKILIDSLIEVLGRKGIKENNLKLYGMKQVVIGTTDGSWVTVATPEKYPLIEEILYWPNGRGSNEVDPADTFVAIVGKEPIKPITL